MNRIWHYKDIFGCHYDHFCFDLQFDIQYQGTKFSMFIARKNGEPCYGKHIYMNELE